MKSLAIILPPREGFRPDAYGAVALCVRDFVLASRFREQTQVLGLVEGPGFDSIHYQQIVPSRHWYETSSKAYARACTPLLQNTALVEVHNRPIMINHLARIINVPIILHLHNDPQEMKGARYAWQRQALLKKCAAVYCVSNFIRQRFLDGVKKQHEKVHVVYNGLALDMPAITKKKQFLYVGRLTPNKGGLIFAEALQQALPNLRGWKGIIIGGRRHSASVNLSDYEKRVANIMNGLGDAASFEGFKPHDHIIQAMHESAVVVVPSLWDEPFGRTALEALGAGAAIITSGRGGLKEVVGDIALIPTPFDAAHLATAMNEIATNTALRAHLQESAPQQAAKFDIGRMTMLLDDIRAKWLA